MNAKLLGAAALAAAMLASGSASAQEYPDRPIRTIVSFTAGGTTDVIARQIAPRLSQRLGQPVVIENKPGAGGTLGTDIVARAPADGHTLLMSSVGPIIISPLLSKKLATDPLSEIVPVVGVAEVPNVLVTSLELNLKSISELVKWAISNHDT